MNSLLRISFHIQALKLITLTLLLSISLIGCSSSSKKNYCDFVVDNQKVEDRKADDQKAGNQKVENKTPDSKSKKEKNKSNSKK